MTGPGIPGKRRVVLLCFGCGALACAAAGAGWRTGAIAAKPNPPPHRLAWELPKPSVRDTDADLRVLGTRRPWTGGALLRTITAAPVAPALPWRLVGIAERDNEPMALILVGMGPSAGLEYRGVGDRLPDGSVLVQIGADSATSEQGPSSAAQRRVYRLFEKAH